MASPRHDKGRTKDTRFMPAEGVATMSDEEWKERLDRQALLTAHTNKTTEGVRHGRFIIPPKRAQNSLADYE